MSKYKEIGKAIWKAIKPTTAVTTGMRAYGKKGLTSGPKKKTILKPKVTTKLPKAAPKSGPKKKTILKPKAAATTGMRAYGKKGLKSGPKKKRLLVKKPVKTTNLRKYGPLAAAAATTVGGGYYLLSKDKDKDKDKDKKGQSKADITSKPVKKYTAPKKDILPKDKPMIKWSKGKVKGGNGLATWSGGKLTPEQIKARRENRSHGGRIKYSRGNLVNRSHGGRISRSRGGLVNRRFITG